MTLTTGIDKNLKIRKSKLNDTDTILELYDAAIQFQTKKRMVIWPKFERSFVEKEIQEQRQWKLVTGNEIVCVWAITFNDKEIWEDRDKNDSIYIHRIAGNPNYRGNRFIDTIVTWAKDYALSKGKQYIRLDTLGNNTRLIEHYTSAGFNFLGIWKLTNTQNLAEHYHREPNCCFFEIDLH
jgi:ribosomal protein S18 acetylase RimI-like enzyme